MIGLKKGRSKSDPMFFKQKQEKSINDDRILPIKSQSPVVSGTSVLVYTKYRHLF